jgi:hypothetical protein
MHAHELLNGRSECFNTHTIYAFFQYALYGASLSYMLEVVWGKQSVQYAGLSYVHVLQIFVLKKVEVFQKTIERNITKPTCVGSIYRIITK